MRSDTGPFAIVPVWLLRTGLSSAALLIYTTLAGKYADREGRAWPRRRTLAEETGLSLDTVDRSVKELIEKGGLIKDRRWKDDGGSTSSVYTLCYARRATDTPALIGNESGGEGGEPHNRGRGAAPVRLGEPHGCGSSLCSSEPDPVEPLATAKKPPSPNTVIASFKAVWETRYKGEKFAVMGPKDSGIAKRLLLALPLLEIEARMSRYLASEKPFLRQCRHSFGAFAGTINEWVATGGEPTLPRIEDLMDKMKNQPRIEDLDISSLRGK
jgi:hypothetical protein